MRIYYDESNHSRKIGKSAKNEAEATYNTLSEYDFLFSFFGAENYLGLANELLNNESEYKILMKIPATSEIKSTHFFNNRTNLMKIGEKAHKYLTIQFEVARKYKDFIQLGCLKKIEVLMRQFWQYVCKNSPFFEETDEAFFYSVTKFLNIHCEKEFVIFSSGVSRIKHVCAFIEREVKRQISQINNPLMQSKRNTFETINLTIKKIKFELGNKTFKFNNSWNYNMICHGLIAIGEEKKIDFDEILVDQEENTAVALRKHFNRTIRLVDSKDEPIIRLIDVFLGFYKKVHSEINKNLIDNKHDVNSVTKFPEHMMKPSESFVEIARSFFSLFDRETYWETFYSLVNDNFVITVLYIRLISEKGWTSNDELNFHANQIIMSRFKK